MLCGVGHVCIVFIYMTTTEYSCHCYKSNEINYQRGCGRQSVPPGLCAVCCAWNLKFKSQFVASQPASQLHSKPKKYESGIFYNYRFALAPALPACIWVTLVGITIYFCLSLSLCACPIKFGLLFSIWFGLIIFYM